MPLFRLRNATQRFAKSETSGPYKKLDCPIKEHQRLKNGHSVFLDSGICHIFVMAPRLLDLAAMIAVLVIFGMIAAGLGMGLVVTALAPLGYQDDAGFHFGQQQGTAQEEFPYLPQPKLA